MEQRTIQILFAVMRSALCGEKLTDDERCGFSKEMLLELMKISSKHDVAHLVAWGLKQNALVPKANNEFEKIIFKAAYRYEKIKYEYDAACDALEKAQIPFLPLKGAVIRRYYPEAWMRTSCDIDILVHKEDINNAITCLTETCGYIEKEHATHDVSLFSPTGIHVELHFDLVEEGRANNSANVLQSVWENSSLCESSEYCYEMSDAFFYFYQTSVLISK